MEGWIKIHQKLLKWDWYDKSEMVHLFLDLLLNASIRDSKWHGVLVPRGSQITSIGKLSARTGISFKTVRTCLKRLEESGEISYKGASKYSMVTISNYDTYQDAQTVNGQTKGKQRANKGQTKGNSIRIIEEKNILTSPNVEVSISEKTTSAEIDLNSPFQKLSRKIKSQLPNVAGLPQQLTEPQLEKLMEKYNRQEIWDILNQMDNKADLRKKYRTVYQTASNWLKNRKKDGNQ